MDKWIGFEFTPNWIDYRLRVVRKSDTLSVDYPSGSPYTVYECEWADSGKPALVVVAERELPQIAIIETHRRWCEIWRQYVESSPL